MSNPKPTVKETERAYLRGNFHQARKDAQTLLKSDDLKDNDRNKLQQIVLGIATDPFVSVSFGITLFLLLFISVKFLL